MSVLYIEPFSGISGDMFLGAMAPLADAEQEIVDLPEKLGLGGVSISFRDVKKSEIACRKVEIELPGAHPRSHSHDHKNHHGHSHDHGHHGHRHLSHIEKMIGDADLASGAKEIALRIFRLLGEVEAAVHDIPIENVHFHEVGALDSIIDIVGAAVLIDKLGVSKTYCDPVCTGFGFVKTAHGRLPVPAPATERLLQGMPTYKGRTETELVTPTGAAILRFLQPDFDPPAVTRLQSSWGAATKDFAHPNALRVSTVRQKTSVEPLVVIQTNIDDISGEFLGADFLSGCLNAGALDAWLTPIIMKKGRPAMQVDALCTAQAKEEVAAFILENTTTLGIRFLSVERQFLSRSIREVETPFGIVRVKIATLPSGKKRAIPEYEDCAARAKEAGVAVRDVYVAALGREA